MSSEEEHEVQQTTMEGGASGTLKEDDDGVQDGNGSSAVQHEDKLGEGWPQIELDRDRGLVVCTIDAQLLSGGFWTWSRVMCPVDIEEFFGRTCAIFLWVLVNR